MSIPPLIVAITRKGWKCQWRQLMKGLGPADKSGNYKRIPSQKINALVPKATNLLNRPQSDLPALIIGRRCPWAHRTWGVYKIRGLEDSLKLIIAKADHQGGRWIIEPSWLECNSLLDIYKLCRTTPNLSLIHI